VPALLLPDEGVEREHDLGRARVIALARNREGNRAHRRLILTRARATPRLGGVKMGERGVMSRKLLFPASLGLLFATAAIYGCQGPLQPDDPPGAVAVVSQAAVDACGDGTCGSDENARSCYADCHCGDDTCDRGVGETDGSCYQDCHCGDGTCDTFVGENTRNCYADCHCNDGRCDPDVGERPDNCSDCFCGDLYCHPGVEDGDSCPFDCSDDLKASSRPRGCSPGR
jgi:hypothetical protein